MNCHYVELSAAEEVAMAILADGEPHDTWGRKTNPDAEHWDHPGVLGKLNANVASRLEAKGLVHYARCGCCGAFLGVKIGAKP